MCPERTLGSYYSGPTRVSLVDTGTARVLNSVKLRDEESGADSFKIPYRILADYYYTVPEHRPGAEGKPSLLELRDFNGDGLALEAAFFEAEACMGLATTLIGYSPTQDRVIHYVVSLEITEQKIIKGRGIVNTGNPRTKSAYWADYLFAEQPTSPGHWSYMVDYTGRGGTQDSYRVHYDPSRERFVGSLASLVPPWEEK